MKEKRHYLTTGEAAALLSISRSTVSRRFDTGALQGKVNPITGERLIARDSVLSFINEHDLPVDSSALTTRSVLMAVSDTAVSAAIHDVCAADPRIDLLSVELGSDALILCAKNGPDLLIIGERFPDIAAIDVVKSLRKRADRQDLKVLCCVPTGRADEFLSCGGDVVVTPDEANSDHMKACACGLLGIPTSPPTEDAPTEHERRWTRFHAKLPAEIAVYRTRRPEQHIRGRAFVENISQGGAFLSRLELEQDSFPAEPFRIAMDINSPPLLGWHADCQVVRLHCNGFLNVGVQFVDISEGDRKKIAVLHS